MPHEEIRAKWWQLKPDKKKLDRIYEIFSEHYRGKSDPWGLDLKKHRMLCELLWPLYKYYFRVKIHNKGLIEDKQYMVVGNHTGQIAIDGILVMIAFTYQIFPPRILRGMVERFLPATPFLNELVHQTGNILGDRQNCLHLLKEGESILVFPEGVRGISKNTADFYKTQYFSAGFFRMALTTKTPILPIAIVGAEEFYPYVYHLKKVAKVLGLPAFPVTPTFPLLGPLGFLPMPSPVDIYVGEPYDLPDLSPDAPDSEINVHVLKIEKQIQDMVNEGLKRKRNYLGRVKNVKRK